MKAGAELARSARRSVTHLVRDARASWSARVWPVVGVFVAVALVPVLYHNSLRLRSMGLGLYVVLAAVGLNFAVGLADVPSLGQGAFVGIGAFTLAWLRVEHGWGMGAALAAALVVATATGVVVGAGAMRLRGVYIAISTWIFGWLIALGLVAFPGISGGAQGLVLGNSRIVVRALGAGPQLTPVWHFEIALVLIALALLIFRTVARSPAGLALAAVRQDGTAAAALGAPRGRLQFGAVVASAAIGGLAGALAVELSGIADPTAYGALLSVKLFVAVLIGGAGLTFGPVIGAAVLGIVPLAASGLGHAAGVAPERFQPTLIALLLAAALIIGRGGLIRRVRAWRDKVRPPREGRTSSPTPVATAAAFNARISSVDFEAHSVTKSFGGVVALDSVSLTIRAGEIHALIGPNGSGKSTFLRCAAGALRPDAGGFSLGGEDISRLGVLERIHSGITRTLQRTEVFPELTVLDHALAARSIVRRYGGVTRNLLSTPLARKEARLAHEDALAALTAVGLDDKADVVAERLSGADQRMLMIAMAVAPRPRLILLDEPSAGMSRDAYDRLIETLSSLNESGISLLVVDHNLRLVRRLAERVTVLDAGRVIVEGTPSEITQSEAARAAYLGVAHI
jgi:branched-chain amino acid transport system permease protein